MVDVHEILILSDDDVDEILPKVNVDGLIEEAVRRRDGPYLKLLLRDEGNEFNLEKRTSEGYTLLMLAAKMGFDDITELLILSKSQMNATDTCGNTSLMLACENGHVCAVKQLLAMGARMNIKNENNETALMKACSQGHYHIINELLSWGVDFWTGNNSTIVTTGEPKLDSLINDHISRIKSSLKKCAQAVIGEANFIREIFPIRCLTLNEGSTFTIEFQHERKDQRVSAVSSKVVNGTLLFVAEAWLMNSADKWNSSGNDARKEIKSRLHGGADVVTRVKHNGVEQTSISKDGNYVFNFNPADGNNDLILETQSSLNSEIKLIVAAYEMHINKVSIVQEGRNK